MDDAEYLFHMQSKTTKRIARGAYAKKGGSRSKRCSLPSDKLTKKEWKERNGKTVSCKMREPMSWAEFKKMPDDLQREYIMFCAMEKKARLKDVAAMFGLNPGYFSVWMSAQAWGEGVFRRTGRKTPYPEWEAFIGKADSEASDGTFSEPMPEPVKEPKGDDAPPTEVKLEHDEGGVLHRGILNYTGHPMYIFNEAFKILDENAKYDFIISFSVKEG